ncbi:MAG: Holliday junction branch migration protein RuvA [Verrucomicrobia bacterium]|nr:Holliday junction branch migration protein RuvA [Verrucomicrobiota bacterium]
MFDYISGKLVRCSLDSVTLEASGIGYRIMIAPNCQSQLPPTTSPLLLYVSFVIREFSQSLYGFQHEADRDLFETLLNVSGIGPKLALSIIGHMPSDTLQKTLFNKDITALCKIPGIGKKTAERLLLELKGVSICTVNSSQEYKEAVPSLVHDAVSALVNLGVTQINAYNAVSKTYSSLNEPKDLELLVTASLRNM